MQLIEKMTHLTFPATFLGGDVWQMVGIDDPPPHFDPCEAPMGMELDACTRHAISRACPCLEIKECILSLLTKIKYSNQPTPKFLHTATK